MMATLKNPPLTITTQPKAEELPAYDVHEIVQGGDQARLILDGQTYLLRITRAGKLILTK